MRAQGAAGVTLVELMIALALSGLLITGIYKVLSGQQETYAVQDRLNEQRQDLRAAMSIMRTEMEKLAYDPNCAKETPACDITGGYITIDSDDKSFEFKYRDGSTTEKVIYDWQTGNHIKRKTSTSSGHVAKDIASLTFTYYDKDGNAITPNDTAGWALLCRIDITIADSFTALPGTGKEMPYADSITASVNVRNPLSDTRNPAHASFDDTLTCAQ